MGVAPLINIPEPLEQVAFELTQAIIADHDACNNS
jgi:hypothetical protein